MDWSAIYTGVVTAIATAGTAITWFEKRVVPAIEKVGHALEEDPHGKQALADAQAALAAKDAAIRDSEIKAAVLQGLYALKNPSAELSAAERTWLQDFVNKAVPTEWQTYVNAKSIDSVLKLLSTVLLSAQNEKKTD